MSVSAYLDCLFSIHERLSAAAKGPQLRRVPYIVRGLAHGAGHAVVVHGAREDRLEPGSDAVGDILKLAWESNSRAILFAAAQKEATGNPVVAFALEEVRAAFEDLLCSYVPIWQDGTRESAEAIEKFCLAVQKLQAWLPTLKPTVANLPHLNGDSFEPRSLDARALALFCEDPTQTKTTLA